MSPETSPLRPHEHAALYLAEQARLPVLADLALRLASLVALWAHRAGTRRALREMEDWQLRDIGLSAAEAQREARKPFWTL